MIAAQFQQLMGALERLQESRNPVRLKSGEREWVRLKWEKIREAQQAADKANNEWQSINDAINKKHAAEDRRRSERGDYPMTDLMKAQAKDASLPLKDALGAGNWHARNAERHIHDLSLFLRLKEMGIM